MYPNSIFFSYATGNINEVGGGGSDKIGSLVGKPGGCITSSDGFGTVTVETTNTWRVHPDTDTTSLGDLTQENSGTSEMNKWPDAARDFGSVFQALALKYVDNATLGDHDNNPTTEDTWAYTYTAIQTFLMEEPISCGTGQQIKH